MIFQTQDIWGFVPRRGLKVVPSEDVQDDELEDRQEEMSPLRVPVEFLPEVGNVVKDPATLWLIDVAKSLGTDLTLVDPDENELSFRF